MSNKNHAPGISSPGSPVQIETGVQPPPDGEPETELERMRRNYCEAEVQLSDALGRLMVARLALRRIAARKHANGCVRPECGESCFPSVAEWALRLLEGRSYPSDRTLELA